MNKYFGTDGIRGQVGLKPIRPDWLLRFAFGYAKVLREEGEGGILIGRDTRNSGEIIESVLQAGFLASGFECSLLGCLPTPAVSYLTTELSARAGIVITASHNCYEDNGIKIFNAKGLKIDEKTQDKIEKNISSPMKMNKDNLGKKFLINNAKEIYINFCLKIWPENLSLTGLKIVIDCANGATYEIVPDLLRQLGAKIHAIGISPNGKNINYQCGVLHLEELRLEVKKKRADLGISFDGDGDRLILIDEMGNMIDGDSLLYIIICQQRKFKRLRGGVVGTVMSSIGLEQSLETLKIPFVRVPVGERFVVKKLCEKGWNLGGESSGHIISFDLQKTGDAIIAALQILAEIVRENKTLSELAQGMFKFPQVLLNVKKKRALNINRAEIERAKEKAQQKLGSLGRIVVRDSGTESLIRIMVEGEDMKIVKKIANDLYQTIYELAS